MAIRDDQTCMLPVLEFPDHGKVDLLCGAAEPLSHGFQLTQEEQERRLPGGRPALSFEGLAGAGFCPETRGMPS